MDDDMVVTEKAGLIGFHLGTGQTYTVDEVADLTGLSRHGAYQLLIKMSRSVPILSENGIWFAVSLNLRE
jgi:hypothetical protein